MEPMDPFLREKTPTNHNVANNFRSSCAPRVIDCLGVHEPQVEKFWLKDLFCVARNQNQWEEGT